MIKYKLISHKLWGTGLQSLKAIISWQNIFLTVILPTPADMQWMFSLASNKVDHHYFRHYLKPCLQQIGRKSACCYIQKVHFYRGFRLFIASSVDFKVQCNELCPSLKHICILFIIGDIIINVNFMY